MSRGGFAELYFILSSLVELGIQTKTSKKFLMKQAGAEESQVQVIIVVKYEQILSNKEICFNQYKCLSKCSYKVLVQ